jgi:hypothetical protein
MLMCCITAAGDALCLLLMFAQPAAREGLKFQIRHGIDLQTEIAPLTCATSQTLERYFSTVRSLTTEINQQFLECEKKPAIAFRDNYSVHMLEKSWDSCSNISAAYFIYVSGYQMDWYLAL